MRTIRIFLASSFELAPERQDFKNLLYEKSKLWQAEKQIFLEMVNWEDFIDAMSGTRLQNKYNEAIETSDIFVMLFWTKVGKYTEEEFDTAWKHFQLKGNPLIYTYFKDQPPGSGAVKEKSLMEFEKKLKVLGHFPTVYKETGGLLLHFNLQLDRLYAGPPKDIKKKAELLDLITAGQLPEAFEEMNKVFSGKNDLFNALVNEYIFPAGNFNPYQFTMRMKVFVNTHWKH